jgi:NADPH-dependent glutamate synthase beta subunit-like oxidoreductase
MELGEPDSSGRPRPVPKAGSEFEVPATTIIAAISQEPDFGCFNGLREGKDWIKTDNAGRTAVEAVYAGGDDIELGLVTIAISQGRFAAEAIDARLRGRTFDRPSPAPCIPAEKVKLDWYKPAPREQRPVVPVDQRAPNTEIEVGFSEQQAIAEATRCMSCGMCMDCETCWMYCTNNCFVRLPKGEHYKVKLEVCNGCKKCADACPCGYIEMI